MTSTLGNACLFWATMINKILDNNKWAFWNAIDYSKTTQDYSASTEFAVDASCLLSNSQWWLFRFMVLVPYFMRALRLNTIWKIGEEESM